MNFFATANIISTQMTSLGNGPCSAEKISNLLSAMATADLLVMAIYFGGLSAMLSWKRLSLLFPGRHVEREDTRSINHSSHDKLINAGTSISTSTSIQKSHMGSNTTSLIMSSAVILLLTSVIVEASVMFEKCVARYIPGMCCASVAAMGTLANTILNKLGRTNEGSPNTRFARAVSKFRTDLGRIGSTLSEFCFLALFGAIGVTANLGTAFSRGISSFAFAILALTVHVFTICLGSYTLMKAVPRNKVTEKIFPLAAEEVLVASNAGIGGASTAAAFAGNLGEDRVSADRKRGLIYAGTVWGVIGYGEFYLGHLMMLMLVILALGRIASYMKLEVRILNYCDNKLIPSSFIVLHYCEIYNIHHV